MTHMDRRLFLTGAGSAAVATGLTGGGAAFGAPVRSGVAGAPSASAHLTSSNPNGANKKRVVRTGAQVAAERNWDLLAGSKVGIVTNPTGILSDLRSIVDVMHEAGTVDIVGIFGPEHGFRGTAQAGEAEGTTIDPRTGLTVYDAYGAGPDKMTELFTTAGVDTIVFDIQDVGSRFYTYIWTMYTAMRAASRVDARFVVLDRPNPVGGAARGPMMTPDWTSGVGAEAIVQAHGMSVGELAQFFNGEIIRTDEPRQVSDLVVVPCDGWSRDMLWAQTGLPWVPPSPNMPTADTALLYPGTGMFEGTNLSEGRGTTRPFELIGAPYVDYRWAAALTARSVPGVGFREAYFTPTFSKHVNTVCGGVQVHITDPAKVDPIRVAVEMLVAAKSLYADFAWRYDSYDPARPYWIDKLTGSTRLRDQITAGASVEEVIGAWRSELARFDGQRRPYLIYRGA